MAKNTRRVFGGTCVSENHIVSLCCRRASARFENWGIDRIHPAKFEMWSSPDDSQRPSFARAFCFSDDGAFCALDQDSHKMLNREKCGKPLHRAPPRPSGSPPGLCPGPRPPQPSSPPEQGKGEREVRKRNQKDLASTEPLVSFFVLHVLVSRSRIAVSTSTTRTLRDSASYACGRGALRTCPNAPNFNARS